MSGVSETKSNIFITGFSGTGKTSVAREVADSLGWSVVDLDEEIVRVSGSTIEEIFRDGGEPAFRALEREQLAEACRGERKVVSTGGGVVMDEGSRAMMGRSGVVVCLEARLETIRRRLQRQRAEAGEPEVRPMLDGPDPEGRIQELKARRQSSYALSDWTVHTDRLTPAEAAEEVVRAWRAFAGQVSTVVPEGVEAATVRGSFGDYPVWVEWGTLGELGERVSGLVSPGAAYVITDEGVYRHARRAQASLESAGIPSHVFLVPPGERSKTIQTAQLIYEWLAGRRAERGHLILGVGGGVVGDLAGFVAATFLRGMPLSLVPTTLLAMVDSAIGGKTGVDLPQGKNLVGAFHQPRFVLADVRTLESLPGRELRSGWAEAIKSGLILDEGLFGSFEEDGGAILSMGREAVTRVVRRCVAIKADVVSRDEKESRGVRILLNYGHTIGHAIEVATGYDRVLHGEAVSVGMMGAAAISKGMGLLSDQEVERQRAVLEAFGLPVTLDGVDQKTVHQAMALDKKTSSGAISWVLLDGIGHAVVRSDVPADLVTDTLRTLLR